MTAPHATGDLGPERSSAAEPAESDPRRSRVLVVDDARDIVTIISRILTRRGYEVLTAGNGNAALELARHERPDLLLLDWMLPGVDGLDVCRQLKSDPRTRGIMVILVTGRGSVDQLVEGFDAGADDYITKPFNHTELLARVRSALRVKRLTDELRERNQQLITSQNELVRSEKMATIGLLASGIAHEFNNIMAGISGYAQLAQRDAKFLPQLVQVALTQSERALELTKSLSAYHRRNGASENRCDVKEIVDSALCLVRKEVESNGIHLDADVEGAGSVKIGPGGLQDVVLNLLINAIHAVGANGSIRISARRVEPRGESEPSRVELVVADDGIGIPPENLGRIFDPFFTTKGALGGGETVGTGLGLSVCYNAIHSAGGRIEVESRPGEGTRFLVSLPAQDSPQRANAAPARSGRKPAEARASARALRILVVDDEAQIRGLVAGCLERHEVTCCSNGEQALRAYEQTEFDVVLLDVCLESSRNGLDVLRELKSRHPTATVVLTTGQLPDDVSAEDLELVAAHITKPFRLEELERTLDEVIRIDSPAARPPAVLT